MNAQKDLVNLLDRAAERADQLGYSAATPKQTWFLAGLMIAKCATAEDVNCGVLNTSATLTKQEASEHIDYYSGAAAARAEAEATTAAQNAKASVIYATRRETADADVEAAFPTEWAIAIAMTGADRREAKRLLRRRFEAQAA